MADKTLSIIIPLYNEEATITELLDRVLAVDLPIGREIIIVNDGSTDDSRGCVDAWQARLPADPGVMVRVIDKPNGGKGSAVRAGIEVSSGDVVIIQDNSSHMSPPQLSRSLESAVACADDHTLLLDDHGLALSELRQAGLDRVDVALVVLPDVGRVRVEILQGHG